MLSAIPYKDRWQIELFFKAIKQGLRIKSFIGASENAVQTQIWVALIAMLVVLPATAQRVCLGTFESHCATAAATVRLSGSVDMAQRPLSASGGVRQRSIASAL